MLIGFDQLFDLLGVHQPVVGIAQFFFQRRQHCARFYGFLAEQEQFTSGRGHRLLVRAIGLSHGSGLYLVFARTLPGWPATE